jgi:D-arabinose 1-dehydrogenase-like Zn-dependent alcohol dehydrogenase
MSYSGKYKAAVITAARKPIELWEYDHIDPGAGCINIAVVRAGVCGTDLHLWQGDSEYEEPFIIGHEGLGRVIALGEGVKTDHSGMPVAVGDVVY